MKNQTLAANAATLLLVLLIGVTGCKRKPTGAAGPTSSESPAEEAPGTPAATAGPSAAGASGGAAVRAPHPGEALDPASLQVAMDQFQRKMQRPPNDWQEMIDAKVLPALPKRKDGQPLVFEEYMEFSIHRAGKSGRP